MAKMTKAKCVTQLVLELTKGITRGEALSRYGKKWQVSDRTFGRYWQEASAQHEQNERDLQAQIKEKEAERTQKVVDELMITKERVLREYARIAFSDITKFYNPDGSFIGFDKLTDDQRSILSAMEVEETIIGRSKKAYVRKFKVWDKKGALDAIVKIMGYNEPGKIEITGKDGEPFFSGFDAFMSECRNVILEDDE